MLNITAVLLQISVTNLVEINHEGGEGQWNGLSGLDAGEDLVHHANPGPFWWNKAANVCQEHYQTNLYWAGVLQCSREFSQSKSTTTLFPLFVVLHNSISSPAHVSLGLILVLSPLRCDIMLWMFQTADLHDDYFTYTAKQLNDVTFLKRHRASISQVLHFVLIIVWPCE